MTRTLKNNIWKKKRRGENLEIEIVDNHNFYTLHICKKWYSKYDKLIWFHTYIFRLNHHSSLVFVTSSIFVRQVGKQVNTLIDKKTDI